MPEFSLPHDHGAHQHEEEVRRVLADDARDGAGQAGEGALHPLRDLFGLAFTLIGVVPVLHESVVVRDDEAGLRADDLGANLVAAAVAGEHGAADEEIDGADLSEARGETGIGELAGRDLLLEEDGFEAVAVEHVEPLDGAAAEAASKRAF